MTLEELEPIVMDLKDKIDTILNTIAESEKKYKHDKGLEEFTERNSEALGKYANKLKELNGDDFDIMSAAFDEYTNDFSDIEEATYVAQLISEIVNKIAKLKKALGEDDIEIHSDAEGELEVNSHDTEITADTSADEKIEDEEPEEEEDEDEAEKEFLADLESEYDKYHTNNRR